MSGSICEGGEFRGTERFEGKPDADFGFLFADVWVWRVGKEKLYYSFNDNVFAIKYNGWESKNLSKNWIVVQATTYNSRKNDINIDG